jgi:predicted 3-demethylubiquinone-9 3-methyltransferase (glyoxalase superfamily)
MLYNRELPLSRMVKIIPHIWFDHNAEEAVALYVSLFPNSSILRVDKYTDVGKEHHGFEAGATMTVNFRLAGQDFMAINGGPTFSINPSISFFVRSATAEDVRALWARLVDNANILMDLGEYPFSSCYGWLSDRFGLSWQIGVDANPSPVPVPFLMFTQSQSGRATEAIKFFTSIFPDSASVAASTTPEGTLILGEFKLAGTLFRAIDGGPCHPFAFNEGVSLVIEVETQEEIDFFWEKLSADPNYGNCGWLIDQFGIRWQIVPSVMNTMLETGTESQLREVTQLVFQMKKLNLEVLKAAFDGA